MVAREEAASVAAAAAACYAPRPMAVPPILYAGVSGLVSAGFSQFYKVRARKGYRLLSVLFGLSVAFALLALVVLLARGEEPLSPYAILLGLPMGVVSMCSIHLYFLVTQRAKLNVTWTVIQLSLVIPFVASILFFGESLDFHGWLGIALILVTLALFAAGKSLHGGKAGVPDLETGLFLAGSSLLTGIGQIFPKVYAVVSPGHDSFTYLFYGGVGMTVYAACLLLVRALRRQPAAEDAENGASDATASGPRAHRWWALPLFCTLMAAFSVFANLLMLLALEGTTGTIAFPLRSAVNLVFTFVFSFLLFGEKASVLEMAGAGTAVIAIAFISGAR
jgi:drug/metabolite transporter (DMT)-like permease